MQQIIDLLKTKPQVKLQGNADLRWIIDTGASNHVTANLSLLRNIKTTENNQVVLSDGQTANCNQISYVMLRDGLIIDNVIFVPKLNCILILKVN